MRVIQVAPTDRLPNLSQDQVRLGGFPNLMVNLPRYICPHCSEGTAFSVGGNLPSPFPVEVLKQFEAFPLPRFTPNEFSELGISDFLCRVCSRPVRVAYRMVDVKVILCFAITVFETAVDVGTPKAVQSA